MLSIQLKAFRLSIAIILSAACMLTSFNIRYAEARQEIIESGKELKGISFNEFWDKTQDEGKKWAGSKLYIGKISSGTFRGFDKHDGLSPIWEVHMVKCNEAKEQKEYGKTLSICKGKGMVLRLVESGIIGLEAGLHIQKEGNFHGAAVDFDRIKLSAQSAEQAANQHMRYRSSGFDNYTYDLKIDQFSNRPVWIIKKACGQRGVAERRCRSKDHWIVKLDGETGEIIR
jgi:hypothetical protein